MYCSREVDASDQTELASLWNLGAKLVPDSGDKHHTEGYYQALEPPVFRGCLSCWVFSVLLSG